MTAPVIDSVDPTSAALSPGQQVDVTVVAHDPDSASGSVQFPVTDSQGNTTQASISLTLDDPITFDAALNPDGLAVAIQQISTGVDPVTGHPQAVYRITAN